MRDEGSLCVALLQVSPFIPHPSFSIPVHKVFLLKRESNSPSFVTVIKTLRKNAMRYTEEEGGRLNNYAIEPKMYQAEPPTAAQKRNYVIFGVLGALLVGGMMFVAFTVS